MAALLATARPDDDGQLVAEAASGLAASDRRRIPAAGAPANTPDDPLRVTVAHRPAQPVTAPKPPPATLPVLEALAAQDASGDGPMPPPGAAPPASGSSMPPPRPASGPTAPGLAASPPGSLPAPSLPLAQPGPPAPLLAQAVMGQADSPPQAAETAREHGAAMRGAQPPSEAMLRQLIGPIGSLAAGPNAASARTVTVALHPIELGKVEIRVERRADGRLAIGITAERAETLALLRTDQAALDRALNQAGMPAEQRSISFDLAGGGQNDAGQPHAEAGRQRPGTARSPRDPDAGTPDAGDALRPGAAHAARGASALGRLDISI